MRNLVEPFNLLFRVQKFNKHFFLLFNFEALHYHWSYANFKMLIEVYLQNLQLDLNRIYSIITALIIIILRAISLNQKCNYHLPRGWNHYTYFATNNESTGWLGHLNHQRLTTFQIIYLKTVKTANFYHIYKY